MFKVKRHHQGFTLIEILIALSIFSIVAIIMTHALHTVISAQTRTEYHANRLANLQIATLLLSRDIEQSIGRPIINAEKTEEPAMTGNARGLTFTHGGYANPFGKNRQSTLQRSAYYFENHQLIRQTWEVLDQVATSKPTKRLLLSDLTSLQFAYIDQDNHVIDKWPSPNQIKKAVLPRAVRVSLTLHNGGKLTQLFIIPGQPFETPHLPK